MNVLRFHGIGWCAYCRINLRETESRIVNGTQVCLKCYPTAVDVALADEKAAASEGAK